MRVCLSIIVLALMMGSASCSRDPEVVKQKYLEKGTWYFEREKYKEASIMYRSALKKDMRYGEAYYRLGLTQMRLRQPIAAAGSFRRAVDLLPEGEEMDDARSKLADIYLAAYIADPRNPKHLHDDIQELSDALLAKDPNSFDGLRLIGYLEQKNGNLKEAIASFQAANEQRPLDPDLVLALSQALAADGRFEESEKLAHALIEKDGTFAPIYHALYLMYLRRNQVEDAENILKLRVENNPTVASHVLELAQHYQLARRRQDVERTLHRLLSNPEAFPDANMLVGDFYTRNREFDAAIRFYERGLEDKDGKLASQRRIADALIAARRHQEASRLVEQILEEHPKDSAALAMRASLMLDTGSREQLQTAIDELQASVTSFPKNPVLRFNLGRAYWAKGDIDQARTQFKAAVDLRTDYLAPRLALGQIHLDRGEFAMAQQTAREVLAMSPSNLPAALMHSVALQGMGNIQQARSDLRRIVEANPDSTDALFHLGMLHFREKNYREAEQTLSKCRDEGEADLRCLMGLVEVYAAQNQYDRSMELLRAAHERAPEKTDIRLAQANLASRAGRFDIAEPIFKELIARSPESTDLHLRMGEAYRRQGKNQLAIEHFQKAKDLNPKDPGAYMPLALLLHSAGRNHEAKKLYEQVLQLQPDNPIALNNLAYLIAELGGDLDMALTYAQRAKQLLPQSVDVSDTLGWIYIKKNLTANAIEIYRGLIAQVPDNPTFRYHMAMALFQKGDMPEARRELQAALRNKPSKEEEGKIRDLMEKIG